MSAFLAVRQVYKTDHKRFLGPSFTWVASEEIKPCRSQRPLGTWEAPGMGSHSSPGSQGVYGLGALRGCAELSPGHLVGTMSAPQIPPILGSPESSWKTEYMAAASVAQMGPEYIFSWSRMQCGVSSIGHWFCRQAKCKGYWVTGVCTKVPGTTEAGQHESSFRFPAWSSYQEGV